MDNERMKKNSMQDVRPTKKSIRSIDVPPREDRPTRRHLDVVENDGPEKKKSSSKTKFTEGIVRVAREKPKSPIPTFPPKPLKHVEPMYEAPHMSDDVVEEQIPIVPIRPKSFSYEYDEPKKSSKKVLYIVGGLFIVALIFGISALFKSAKITVSPKHQIYTLNNTFVAKKDATGSDLGFQIVTITKDAEKTVAATGQKEVDKKATGTIVIFNNYSTTPQKLVATTRFETPEGLIFRLVSPVTVPGQQTKSGKVVAGSVEAVVEADASGDTYNITLKDFTIPGFKGDPRYAKIYARSKTPMSGGFSGIQKTVSDDIASSTDAELTDTLKSQLSSDITSQIPANFVMYNNGVSYSFTPTSQAGSTDAGAILKKTGTAYAIIFDKGTLTRSIVSNMIGSTTDNMVKITNLNALQFTYPSGTSFDPTGNDTTLTFSLAGNANFVWVFDENKLKSDLLGLTKTQARAVLATYPVITEVWLQTSPFWNQTIPRDPSKVTLVNTMGE